MEITRVTFSSTDANTAASFRSLRGDVQYGLRKFPATEAYHEAVTALGVWPGTLEIPRLYALAQRDWHIRGQTGCQFARLSAKDADSLRWDYVVVTGLLDEASSSLGPRIDGIISQAVDDHTVQILSLLLPDVTSAVGVVHVLRNLVQHSRFWLERDEVQEGMHHFHLRYPIKEGIQAWALAFAPFDFLPNTRRGPYVELIVRVKEKPKKLFHRLNQDRDVAHLADVPLTMSDRHWEDRFDSTLRRTRMILGGSSREIAAARSTIVIPEALIT